MAKAKKKICVICRKPYEEFRNNAQPVVAGFCCDSCNSKVVLPARFKAAALEESEREAVETKEE
jgi:hypothetical protein